MTTVEKKKATNRCARCGHEWGGYRLAHCGGCHRTFSGLWQFDRHRVDFACIDPASLADVEYRDGVWARPQMTDSEKEAMIAARRGN